MAATTAMTTVEFLSHLRSLDVELWAEGDQLRFSAAPGAMTPSLREELVKRKSDILRLFEEAGTAARLLPPPIEPVPRDQDLPLSFAQQRLWFLDQLEPGSYTYNIAPRFRLHGPLNLGALRWSLNEIIRRHEGLRTAFPDSKGKPVQRIAPVLDLEVPVLDLRHLPAAARENEVQRLSTEERQRPFDLARGPLLRATVLCQGDLDHLLLITVHHIVADGWSMGVFVRELESFYPAYVTGEPVSLPGLPVQYADFALRQRQWLQGEALESQLSYWKQQLDATLPVLQLPADRPRPLVQSYRGTNYSFVLPERLTEELQALSRQEGCTLFMTLLAAFQTLLYRYTGQEDLVVGSPIANRNQSEIEGLIGFFVNTLVMRTSLAGNPTFRELLGRVREVALGAYAHQDLPFEKLVEELQPERNLSYSPLFQVMFVVQNSPMQPLRLDGLEPSTLEYPGGTAKVDLTLYMEEDEQRLTGTLEYSTELFDAATMRRMAGHFQALLEGIVARPEQRLADLPLLSAAERKQLLVEWNDTRREYPADLCIHQRFETMAAETPDAVALVCGERQLTYRELNCQANQLAHYLRRLGVGPDTPVGICVERSLEMVVGLLGILKAGGAYVPLDAAYPKARLSFMLEDTGVPVLVTQSCLTASLPECAARVVCLDAHRTAILEESEEAPESDVTASHLAYVMYTSGSTGRPKGVSIPHRAVLRLLLGVEYARLDAGETFLQMAPISFDASTFEIWGPLLHGGRCVLFPGRVPSPHEIGLAVRTHGVTTLWLTASLFNTVIEEEPEALSGVRQLLIGGEALSVRHVNRALQLLPSTQIINGYGPTESTTFACCHPIRRDLDAAATSIPIGQPIANTQVYILDEQRALVPAGVAGELCIGGDGLARGYLHRPELTTEKFVPNPFSTESGARLYRTGDLARWRPDGRIDFLGRLDHQVKIRGFRIELGEVEAALLEHPAVREAAVVVRQEVPSRPAAAGSTPAGALSDVRLVAYLASHRDQVPTTNELRRFMREVVPEYMVPSAFVLLDNLPLTPSGKVDRRALPSLEGARPDLEAAYVPPTSVLERRIALMWQELLQVDRVGVNDNFFDLGGHSLLIIQLQSRLRELLDRDVSVVEVFQYPTISALASHWSEQKSEQPSMARIHDRAGRQREALARQRALRAGKRGP